MSDGWSIYAGCAVVGFALGYWLGWRAAFKDVKRKMWELFGDGSSAP